MKDLADDAPFGEIWLIPGKIYFRKADYPGIVQRLVRLRMAYERDGSVRMMKACRNAWPLLTQEPAGNA